MRCFCIARPLSHSLRSQAWRKGLWVLRQQAGSLARSERAWGPGGGPDSIGGSRPEGREGGGPGVAAGADSLQKERSGGGLRLGASVSLERPVTPPRRLGTNLPSRRSSGRFQWGARTSRPGGRSAPSGRPKGSRKTENLGGALTTWRISPYSRARKSRVAQRGKAFHPQWRFVVPGTPVNPPRQTSIRLQRWFSLNSKPEPLWPTRVSRPAGRPTGGRAGRSWEQ